MESQSYTVKTGGFEGPFGVLLHLVEEKKLFINDVSLAAVTEDYLKYMNALPRADYSEMASFAVVASTLILIKSKSLLPNLALTDEEQGDIRSLEERLRLFKIFTEASANIKNIFGKKIIFPLAERKMGAVVFLPDNKITKESMMAYAEGLLEAMPKKTFMPEVEVKKVVSIEEMIDRLTERIKSAVSMSFRKNFGGDKVETIVGFLAMLELVRQGFLDAVQQEDDIMISKLEPSA